MIKTLNPQTGESIVQNDLKRNTITNSNKTTNNQHTDHDNDDNDDSDTNHPDNDEDIHDAENEQNYTDEENEDEELENDDCLYLTIDIPLDAANKLREIASKDFDRLKNLGILSIQLNNEKPIVLPEEASKNSNEIPFASIVKPSVSSELNQGQVLKGKLIQSVSTDTASNVPVTSVNTASNQTTKKRTRKTISELTSQAVAQPITIPNQNIKVILNEEPKAGPSPKPEPAETSKRKNKSAANPNNNTNHSMITESPGSVKNHLIKAEDMSNMNQPIKQQFIINDNSATSFSSLPSPKPAHQPQPQQIQILQHQNQISNQQTIVLNQNVPPFTMPSPMLANLLNSTAENDNQINLNDNKNFMQATGAYQPDPNLLRSEEYQNIFQMRQMLASQAYQQQQQPQSQPQIIINHQQPQQIQQINHQQHVQIHQHQQIQQQHQQQLHQSQQQQQQQNPNPQVLVQQSSVDSNNTVTNASQPKRRRAPADPNKPKTKRTKATSAAGTAATTTTTNVNPNQNPPNQSNISGINIQIQNTEGEFAKVEQLNNVYITNQSHNDIINSSESTIIFSDNSTIKQNQQNPIINKLMSHFNTANTNGQVSITPSNTTQNKIVTSGDPQTLMLYQPGNSESSSNIIKIISNTDGTAVCVDASGEMIPNNLNTSNNINFITASGIMNNGSNLLDANFLQNTDGAGSLIVNSSANPNLVIGQLPSNLTSANLKSLNLVAFKIPNNNEGSNM